MAESGYAHAKGVLRERLTFMLFIDIETGPASEEVLTKLRPDFKAPANYKDPDKIAANIAEQAEAWKANAALEPITGQILAVGTISEKGFGYSIGDETKILNEAFNLIFWHLGAGDPVVGFCIKRFDLPYLVKRGRIHGIKPPVCLINRYKGRLYWAEDIIDLQEEWNCGLSDTKGQSLDAVAKALGLPPKLGDGKDFAALFASNQSQALEYLKRDLEITRDLAQKIL